MIISCLCVTHERPEFMPWVVHQFQKQYIEAGIDAELLIVDSSAIPFGVGLGHNIRVLHVPKYPGIADKRTIALCRSRGLIVTWFDDDDWQSPRKLQASEHLAFGVCAVGSRNGRMYSTSTGKMALYESFAEPLIFNSALYLKADVPSTFDSGLITGEDTEWHGRFFDQRPNFLTLGNSLSAWLCHQKNITNKSSSRFFERVNDIPFDSWEREFLAELHK